VCRNEVRKIEALMVLNLEMEMKGNKKGFYKYISSKRKSREKMCLLPNVAGDLMTKD